MLFADAVGRFGAALPRNLVNRNAHLDPDFEYLTYGDRDQRAARIRTLEHRDLVVFYAALQDTRAKRPLVYAIIGLFVVAEIIPAREIPEARRHENAHTRRETVGRTDIVVRAHADGSGRLTRCLPFAEQRGNAYRVRQEILDAWGDISVRNGFVQRSVHPPEILDPSRFLKWFESRDPTLVARNN